MNTEIKNTETRSKNSNGVERKSPSRLEVKKTYKLYINGKFPRTESGRYYKLNEEQGKPTVNICRASRKDFRDAVVAARKAQGEWAKKSAYNRSQILYRIAETLEGRKAQLIESLIQEGSDRKNAESETALSIDRLVYYSGWCDKYQQVFSSVNPAEGSYFNFSFPEPMGVVSIIAPEHSGLLGLISVIAPCIAGGNTCVVLASQQHPLSAIDLAEVIHASDVPAGVINLLTGFRSELLAHFASHMDVNAIIYANNNQDEIKKIQELSSLNVKRALIWNKWNWMEDNAQNPYLIMDIQEIKTTWHPVGI
jgi:acyl-CoA reductase-like NAD-dependent aldehyde dehydrogenase